MTCFDFTFYIQRLRGMLKGMVAYKKPALRIAKALLFRACVYTAFMVYLHRKSILIRISLITINRLSNLKTISYDYC